MRGGKRRWNVSNDASAHPRPALGLVFSANEQRTATRGEGEGWMAEEGEEVEEEGRRRHKSKVSHQPPRTRE